VKNARLALVALALVITACGDPTVGGSGDSTTTTGAALTTTSTLDGTLDIIVPPDVDGELPSDLMVGCPSGPAFPVSALETIVPLEDGDPGIATAARSFLESEEGEHLPGEVKEGWLILHQDEVAVLLAISVTDGLGFMSLGREGAGWVWTGAQFSGPCPLQYTVPEDLNTVDWRLDESAPPPAPDDVTVAVLLNERQCVSGQEIGDRLRGPQVVMTETQLFIAFAAEPPPGDAFNCQSNPDVPYVVDLGEPLGERELVEGLATGLDLEDYLP
jgi:hypothetical protein